MIVLDPQDEKPDNVGFKWFHKSDMIKNGNVTFSFMCRVVRKSVEVNTRDSSPIKKEITENFKKRLDDGAPQMCTLNYFFRRLELEKAISDMLQKYNVK